MRGRYIAWIASEVWQSVCFDAARKEPLETGGMLIGYWASKSDVVITRSLAAGPEAKHRRAAFSPDQDYQERELARIYGATGGVETYLGDWHTHPGQDWPVLSGKDRSTLKRIARAPEARAPTAVTMILGGSGNTWHARLWTGRVLPFLRLWERLVVTDCELKHFDATAAVVD